MASPVSRLRRWFALGAILMVATVAGMYFYARWSLRKAVHLQLVRDSDGGYGCRDVFLRALESAQGGPRPPGENGPGHSADRRGLFDLQVHRRPHTVYGERFQGGSVQRWWTGGLEQRQDRHLRQGCRSFRPGYRG